MLQNTTPAAAIPKEVLEKLNKAYDSDPWWYDFRGYGILKLAYRSGLWTQLRFFSKNLKPRHLEIAVGSGSLFKAILLLRGDLQSVSISAFDIAERMLAGAHKRLKHIPHLELFQASASSLPFENDSFDSANMANAYHCLPEPKEAINEVYRVLKPDGTLALNVLLEPSTKALSSNLARKINTWAMKKGILQRPYLAEDVVSTLKSTGFKISIQKIEGHTLYLLAHK